MTEVVIITLVFVMGWLLLAALGLRDWGIVPLGFLVGTFLLVVVGFVLVVTGLPTYPRVIMGVGLIGSGGLHLLVRRRGIPLRMLAVGIGLIIPLVLALREANLVKYHIDSFRYLVASGLLATNSYDLATMNQLEKRLLAAPFIHSMASINNGEWYLQSHAPLLSLTTLGFLAWVLLRGREPMDVGRRMFLLVGLAVLLVATNNRMIWNSFYVNDHLVFGAAFLVACASSWLLVRRTTSTASPLDAALLLALPTLVVTRPEGFIAGALAVLPFVLSGRVSVRARVTALAVLAGSTMVWFGYVSMVLFARGGGFSVSSLGPALAGLGGIAAIPILVKDRLSEWQRRILLLFETGLWVSLAALAIRDPGTLIQSLRSTYQNLVLGAGSWGYSVVALSAIGLIALLVSRDKSLLHLRFPLTAFIPVLLLLAYLRGGAYRVGSGDSLNRMLMQIVPVAVLYVAAVAWSRAAAEEPKSTKGWP